MTTRRQFLLLTGLSALGLGVKACGNSDTVQHWSDCSTNNMPASPNGPCDCFHVGARIEHKRSGQQGVVDEIMPYGFWWIGDGGTQCGVTFTGFKNWRKMG